MLRALDTAVRAGLERSVSDSNDPHPLAPVHELVEESVVGRQESTQIGRFPMVALYNVPGASYNAGMNEAHVMTVSRNGQVSIPAEARARWNTRRVLVVDLGDRVVMRPLSDDSLDDLEGKYRGRGPTTDRTRKQTRDEDARRANSR